MDKKEEQRITWRFLKEAIEEHERQEKSGELHTRMSQSVRGKLVAPPKKSQEN